VRIVPAETELTAAYWSAAREGAIALQRCRACGHVWHPPAPVCPACRATDYEWFRSAGAGRLYSYTRVEHAAHPAVADRLPYLVALVELDEGPRVVCGLLADVDELGPGLAVTIATGSTAGGLELPVARPARGSGGAIGRDRRA
jgi:uncharacterized OB-fold protein